MSGGIRRVNLGLLGAGRVARNRIAPAIHAARNASLYAAASRELARAEGLTPTVSYGSYQELLDDPQVDAVVITTHNGLHAELAIAAMRAGKHVFCEKPLALDAAECERIVAVSRETGRILVEAFMYRYHPQVAAVERLVAGGAIGELRSVEATFAFRLAPEEPVRLRREWGGGALMDVGCYCVNAARLFLGNDPSRVMATASFDPVSGVDLSLSGILGYDDGRFAVISCSFEAGLHQKVVLIGTDGVLEMHHPFKTTDLAGVSIVSPRITLRTQRGEEQFTADPVNTYQLEVEDFARAVATGSAALLGPEEGLRNAKIIDRVLSAARRSMIELPSIDDR